LAKYDNSGKKKPIFKTEEFWESVLVVFIALANQLWSLGLESGEVIAITVPFILLIINEIVINKEEAKKNIG